MRHTFKIPIGDWSNDGHGKCDWFIATAAKPVEEVRIAYFAAKKMKTLKGLDPESFCHGYGEGSIPDEKRAKLHELGAPIDPVNAEGDYEFGPDEMAAIVVWFLNQGDPELKVKLSADVIPMLPFYGYENGKHIGHIGYGLHGD
jgi:hypothetical protein